MVIAVAEMALSLMMAVLRRTCFFDARTRAGEGWTADPSELDSVGEVAGRTVGLVGFGHSAQLLAPVLAALGARVVYTARSARDVPYEFWSLDRLLAESDIVSLHIPLTDETRGAIDPFAMKKRAVLVNTARGELVDQGRLVEALASGHLRGAGLDVFAEEPLPRGNPLLGLPNAVLAPHIAWLTPETLARSLSVAHENCRRLVAGEALQVRFDDLAQPRHAGAVVVDELDQQGVAGDFEVRAGGFGEGDVGVRVAVAAHAELVSPVVAQGAQQARRVVGGH